MGDFKTDLVLDLKGLACPMPVLKTKKAIDGMASGQTVEVMSTDPASKADIPAFLDRVGHELVRADEKNGVFCFVIKKNGS